MLAFVSISAFATGCGDRVVAEIDRTIALDGDTELLVLDDNGGDLVIEGEDRDDIRIEIELSGPSSEDDRTHERVADEIEIRVDRLDETTQQLVADLPSPPRGYSIDVVAHVPQHLAMDISDGHGDLVIRNVADLDVIDGSGDTVIADIHGGVRVDDDSGDLVLTDIDSDIEVTDKSGDLAIANCDGDVLIYDGSGDMGLIDIAGAVTIYDGSGDIGVVHAGSVDVVRDGSGDVGITP